MVKNWGVQYFLLKANYTPENIATKVKQIISGKPLP